MEFLKVITLVGPNRWAPVSVLEGRLHAGALSNAKSVGARRLVERLTAWLPTLAGLVQRPSGLAKQHDIEGNALVERLSNSVERARSPVQLVADLVPLLHAAVGVRADFRELAETDEPGVYFVVAAFEEEALGRACFETAREACDAGANGDDYDWSAAARRLADLADDARLGPSSRAIIRAAESRGIPYRRLTTGSLVQLGEGKHQRRIWTAETDATSAIAEAIAQDKDLTKRLLRSVGVPVPHGRPVTSADDAWVAACEIGVPVAVKPRKANHARGISLNVSTREQIVSAYEWALAEDASGVIVEQYCRGQAHRLLVVGSRMVAAARGEAEYVVGDGRRTIRELVDEANRDPRRGENYTDPLGLLTLDPIAVAELQRQGLTPDSVPASGERVLVQPIGDLTTDCTTLVHPANAEYAVLAARVVGLDIAGLDVIAEDIGRPLDQQRGAVLEVNAGPSLGMHVAPLHGKPQPVGQAIVDRLYPPGANGRIPLAVVTGAATRARLAARLEAILAAPVESQSYKPRRTIGRATSEGIFVNGRLLAPARPTDAEHWDALLMHPDVEMGLFELRPEQAAASGLGYWRADVAIVTDVPAVPDAPRDAGIALWDNVMGGIVAAVRAVPSDGTVVLPVASHATPLLARLARGGCIYYGGNLDPALVARLLATGARLLTVRDSLVVFARQEGEETYRAPESLGADESLELAALAAAWALGRIPEQLASSPSS